MTKANFTIAHIHVWDKKNKGDVGIVLAVQELLQSSLGKIKIIDLPIEALKNYDKINLKKINSADLVIVGGGGIFYRYFMPFDNKVIQAIKKPIVIFGVGYIREVGSRPLKKDWIKSIINLVKKATLVGVRDYYTKSFLVTNGINKNKINLIGDPAIFLSEKKPKNFKLQRKINIGFNLNYSGWLGFGKWEKDILNSYLETANYFKKKYKANIFYLMHHPDEINVLNKIKTLQMKIIDQPANEQKYIYGQLDLVIGMMLHSCVMAFGAVTPEINIAYDIRNKNFAKFIHCPELVIPLSKLSSGALLKTAKNVWKNYDKYCQKFSNRKNAILQKQKKFLIKINNLLAVNN